MEGQGGSAEQFAAIFRAATGFDSYPYQTNLATSDAIPPLISVPTGCGKTAAVILAWIWRRRFAGKDRGKIPRRLAYCLPMRVLVEQTAASARRWIESLRGAGFPEMQEPLPVHSLMGGEDPADWASSPEGEAMLVGTQDMLLSRALNRGYGASPFRWPREFGLLNNDCLWVFDEVQLMDVGLATAAQLAAFRSRFGTYGTCQSIWMSATLDPAWLRTADFRPAADPVRLAEPDREHPQLGLRLRARKVLVRGRPALGPKAGGKYTAEVAALALGEHRAGSLTLVVVNTVERAGAVHGALRRLIRVNAMDAPDLRLLHSRFRPAERRTWVEFLAPDAPLPGSGRLIVSTQVVEAGVDLSARTLITELAPWPSLVQRIGRCNRFGDPEDSTVIWLDVDDRQAAPYSAEETRIGRARLAKLEGRDVSPDALEGLPLQAPYEPPHLLRFRDFVDLFDTTPDLSTGVVDISRFIRSTEELDALVFWRDFERAPDEAAIGFPVRHELCSVPVSQVREFVDHRDAWAWDRLEGGWRKAGREETHPGTIVLVRSSDGGYLLNEGWSPKARGPVPEVPGARERAVRDFSGGDPGTSRDYWQTLQGHARRTAEFAVILLEHLRELDLSDEVRQVCTQAALLHDIGKAHPVFQATLLRNLSKPEREARSVELWAKSSRKTGRHERPHFRHELASAIALLDNPVLPGNLTQEAKDLVCYLVAAHHGKVRMSLRSLPGEIAPPDGGRFARGVWDGDALPAIDLGDGVSLAETGLDLGPMELGLDAKGRPSWTDRVLSLRDRPGLGPFRLAFLEALVRAADARASDNPGSEGVDRG